MKVVVVKGSFRDALWTIQNARGDAIEIRLDLLEDLKDLPKLRQACKLPVIFAGANTFMDCLSLNPTYVDLGVECDSFTFTFLSRHYPSISLIHSYHSFTHTPEDLNSVLQELQKRPASFYKIATYANSTLDSLRMLCFVKKAREEGIPVAGMCMGPKGKITRILAPAVKSLLTYVPLEDSLQTAPGQISLQELEHRYNFSALSPKSAVYGLIGDPVDQSIGHLFHNRLLRKLGRDALYVKLAVKVEELPVFFAYASKLKFKGLSVTMPLKEAVLPFLDSFSPEVKAIKAANTLRFEKGKWRGYNTDGKGGLDTLGSVKKKQILVYGAGGAARALIYEAMQRGGEVTVTNRTFEKAQKLAIEWGCKAKELSSFSGDEAYDILIHAAPANTSPIKLKTPPKRVLDIAYQSSPKGLEMFVRQALMQLEVWLDCSFDELEAFCDAKWYEKDLLNQCDHESLSKEPVEFLLPQP